MSHTLSVKFQFIRTDIKNAVKIFIIFIAIVINLQHIVINLSCSYIYIVKVANSITFKK